MTQGRPQNPHHSPELGKAFLLFKGMQSACHSSGQKPGRFAAFGLVKASVLLSEAEIKLIRVVRVHLYSYCMAVQYFCY